MNILFLSFGNFDDLNSSSVHIDILKRLSKDHKVYLVCKSSAKGRHILEYTYEYGVHVVRTKLAFPKKLGIIEKGLSLIAIEPLFIFAIKKYFNDIKFDLVLYTTPPITLANVVKYVKKRDCAKSYLMLKDIFPQNAVDIGILSKHGAKGLLYLYFRYKEKQLYKNSDCIGCMSQANIDFVLKNNKYIDENNVEYCPNCTIYKDMRISINERCEIRKKYNIPLDKKVFVYGGNLGAPQDIPFVIECLKMVANNNDENYFLIVGSGTEFGKLQNFYENNSISNMLLMSQLPKDEYDVLIAACDVGLIFLDHRFTIPNFPSRLLGYMQAGLPIIACTDPNTDIGMVLEKGKYGWWCESNNPVSFKALVESIDEDIINEYGMNAFNHLSDYDIDVGYNIIMSFYER